MNTKEDNIFHASISHTSTMANQTGSWRYLTPIVEIKKSPCEAACPLAVPISDFILELEKGNIDEAARLIKSENPFPSICGRVCIHPCEDNCSRGLYDRSIAIHILERYAGDHSSAGRIDTEKKMNRQIAVVGAGPAGLSAAYFLLIMGYEVTLFEANAEPGGILRYIIPEYRLPKSILRSAIEDLFKLGLELKGGKTLGKNLSFEEINKFDAVFLGTGAWIGKRLDPDSRNGIISGIEILRWIENGEIQRIGSRIIIIGGGNTAIDVARSLLRLGRKPVILYRREIKDMPAFYHEVREAMREGIEIKTGMILKEIIRTDDSIAGVKCARVTFDRSSPDIKDIFNEIGESEIYLEADQVVSAIGETPDTSLLPEAIEIQNGKVVIDRFGQTALPNIFAGGDLISQPHLVVYALASGKRAAVAIDATIKNLNLDKLFSAITIDDLNLSFKRYRELRNHFTDGDEKEGYNPAEACKPEAINLEYFNPLERAREKRLPLAERTSSFKEVNFGYSDESASFESGRCFHCGYCISCDNCIIFCPDISIRPNPEDSRVVIDYDYCKGCGLCAEECPRGVIEMKREAAK